MNDMPEIECVCCMKPLTTAWQPSIHARMEGYRLLTCWTPDCPLNGYTFGEPDYPPEDLFEYVGVQLP